MFNVLRSTSPRTRILLGLSIALILAITLYAMLIVSMYYVDGPGFRSISLSVNTHSGQPKSDNPIIFKSITVGHIKNEFRRNLPPDHKGYPRFGLDKVVNQEFNPNEYFNEKFIKILPEIAAYNPDVLFVTGDVMPLYTIDVFERDDGVRNVQREREVLEYCWDMVMPVLNKGSLDVIIAPGNHDIYGPTAESVYKKKVGPPYYSVAKKNVRIVVLNSVAQDSTQDYNDKWARPADLPVGQIDFLKRGLDSEWQEETVFVIVHHNPMRIKNWMSDVHPILVNSKSVTVFSGTRFGTCKFNIEDDVAYMDGGFDLDVSFNPSYYIVTEIWQNGEIQHTIHPVLPSNAISKIKVLSGSIGALWSWFKGHVKKHFVLFSAILIMLVSLLLWYFKFVARKRK